MMNDFYFEPTKHSVERAKQRHGLNEKKACRQINLAIVRGKTSNDFSSWEKNYLEGESKDGGIAVAYSGYCYIFDFNGACITMYPLPNWFNKKKHFDGKERIRNYKRYCKTNMVFSNVEC